MNEWDMERASKRIAEEAAGREVGTLVLGLPKNMDGSEGVRAEKSREFKAMLERDSGLPVVLWDERPQQHRGARDTPRGGQKGKAAPKNRRCCRGEPDIGRISGEPEVETNV